MRLDAFGIIFFLPLCLYYSFILHFYLFQFLDFFGRFLLTTFGGDNASLSFFFRYINMNKNGDAYQINIFNLFCNCSNYFNTLGTTKKSATAMTAYFSCRLRSLPCAVKGVEIIGTITKHTSLLFNHTSL